MSGKSVSARGCFLALNLILAQMVFFMVYCSRTFHHHEITTIALAIYMIIRATRALDRLENRAPQP